MSQIRVEVRACPSGGSRMPPRVRFGWRSAQKHSETAWDLEKCTCCY
jgi:hypothetical protein